MTEKPVGEGAGEAPERVDDECVEWAEWRVRWWLREEVLEEEEELCEGEVGEEGGVSLVFILRVRVRRRGILAVCVIFFGGRLYRGLFGICGGL